MKFFTKYPLRITIPLFLFVTATIISVYSMMDSLWVSDAEVENSGMTFVTQDMSQLQGAVNSFLQEGNIEATKVAIANSGSAPNAEFVLLADENNVVLHATRGEFSGLPIRQAVPDIDADLINDAKKTMSGKAMLSKNRDSLSVYYPVVIGARPHELRPSRVGILFTKYDLTYLKAARRYEIEHQAWRSVSLYCVLFLSLGIILYYALTKRLLRLVAAANRFAAGDTSTRSGLQGKDEIAQIGKAFDSMVQKISTDQEALRASEDRFHAIFEQAGDGVFILDTNGKIILINEAFARMHGFTMEEMLRMGLERLDVEGTAPVPDRLRRIMAGETLTFEVEHYHKDGHTSPLSVTANLISSGREQLILAVHRDITERKLAEDKIKASLLEKETMLKEIHHRVKNSLQVIASLLNMQSSHLQDEKARAALQDSMARVRTMAMIHAQLYQSQDLARVDFGSFIRDLISNISQSHVRAVSPVEIHADVGMIDLGIDTSIPCGLILNELISNALKHAFPEGKEGEINIRMRLAENQVALTVQDNGVGFPESVDLRNLKSLGMELVNILVGQINGTIDMQVDGGTTWTIAFPLKKEREWRNG